MDEGETVFEHLFPLVLPEGHGDHRYKSLLQNITYYEDYILKWGFMKTSLKNTAPRHEPNKRIIPRRAANQTVVINRRRRL